MLAKDVHDFMIERDEDYCFVPLGMRMVAIAMMILNSEPERVRKDEGVQLL